MKTFTIAGAIGALLLGATAVAQTTSGSSTSTTGSSAQPGTSATQPRTTNTMGNTMAPAAGQYGAGTAGTTTTQQQQETTTYTTPAGERG